MSTHTPAVSPPHLLSALTLVLGPPREPSSVFTDFQAGAAQGVPVADHAWAQHEHEALTALTHRDGSISTHTLLETLLGGVLKIGVLVADVERSWVRHADGQLYAALTIASEDVRPRAGGLALHDPSLVDALNAVTDTIATLDGRAWMQWSSRSWHDPEDATLLSRSAALVGQMAELVIRDSPAGLDTAADTEVELEAELLVAIRYGRAHAELSSSALTRELRALRHRDPMRTEWTRIVMDAFYLGALNTAQLQERVESHDAASLAYLYLGRERSDRLKANPDISPRFRGEIAAKTFMTAYALERLAPVVSASLISVMTAQSGQDL
jgi:hypothetical protein